MVWGGLGPWTLQYDVCPAFQNNQFGRHVHNMFMSYKNAKHKQTKKQLPKYTFFKDGQDVWKK